MGFDTHQAATHFCVELAGQGVEQAISFLGRNRLLEGKFHLNRAITWLQRAVGYLQRGGQPYAGRMDYMNKLIAYYQGEVQKLHLGARATKTVADELYDHMVFLLAADPVLGGP